MERNEINRHIGRRLKSERRRRDLTQAELGRRCGFTFQQVHKYEAGIVTISAGALWQLAEALSIQVADLFPWTDRTVVHMGLGESAPH